jgi:hypothetical protein
MSELQGSMANDRNSTGMSPLSQGSDFTQESRRDVVAELVEGPERNQVTGLCIVGNKPAVFVAFGEMAQDHQLLHDWLTVGPRWKQLPARKGT